MTTNNSNFKVKKGLQIEGGNIQYSSSQNATASVDASSAADTVGKTLTLTSGLGTGDEAGGSLLLQGGGNAGSAGTDATTAVTALTINSAGNTTVDNNLTVSGTATVSGASLDVNAITTITGDSANQEVTLIQTSPHLSASGDVFRVQRHDGSSTYYDALRVSAKTGNVGIKGAPDTTTTASAKALTVTGNVDFTGSLGTASNDAGVTNIWAAGNVSAAGYLNLLPATVTPATGEIIGAFGKIRDSTGFVNIANQASKKHSVIDFEKEGGGFTNFYTSDVISESLTTASDDKAAGNLNFLMKINLTGGNSSHEVFGATDVFAVMQIVNNATPPEIVAYRVEKITGFASTSTVTQESQVLDESTISYGRFELGFQPDGLSENSTSYATMNLNWRWTQPFAIVGSTDYTVKWAFNVNGLSLDPGALG
jgi:hypothetical protein